MSALPNGAADTGPVARRRPGIGAQRSGTAGGTAPSAPPPLIGPTPGPPPPAMRNAERLVQVQVAHIRADPGRAGQPHLRVHVGAVHVDLPAGLVHRLADRADIHLEHAMRARIGDHQRRQFLPVLRRLRAQIGKIDVAVTIAANHHHAIPGHRRTRRIGAVRAGRNQTDIARAVTAAFVPGADRQQSRIFALAAGIRLDRHAREPGYRLQPICYSRSDSGFYNLRSDRRARTGAMSDNPGQVTRNHFRRKSRSASSPCSYPAGIMLRFNAMSFSSSRRR